MPSTTDRSSLSWLRHLGKDVPGGLVTLATVEPGECVEVLAFLSPLARQRSAGQGVAEGLRLLCRDRTKRSVTVELPAGHCVSLDAACARLVRVERIPADACPRLAAREPA